MTTTPLDVLMDYIHPFEPAWVAMLCSAVVATCGMVDCARKDNKKMLEKISRLDAKDLKEIRKEVKKCKMVSRNIINMNVISTCCLGREFILFPQAPCLFLAGFSCYVVLKSIAVNKRAKMLRADNNFGRALSSSNQQEDQVIYVSSMMKLAIIRNEIEKKLALRNEMNVRIQNEERKLAREEEISLTLTNIYRNSSDASDVSVIRVYDVNDEITELKEEVREICGEMLVNVEEISAAKYVATHTGEMSTGDDKIIECKTPQYLPTMGDYGDYDDFTLYNNTIYD